MIKRLFDIVASFFGIILLIPVFLTIAILIKIRMPGPVLFRQIRTGRHGKPFSICKFRTMTLNHNGNAISVKGESRITPVGATLRKYKLDELPELWNVLKGDMSFVGPRPDMPEYASRLFGEEEQILELRPGITSPATLVYANEEEILVSVSDPQKYNDEVIWPDKVRMNLEYYHNHSFTGDLKIILKTIFRGRFFRTKDLLVKSKIFILSILLIIGLALVSAFHNAGHWLVKDDNASSADAIVILMGSISDRVHHTADLYNQVASKVIIVGPKNNEYKELEVRGVFLLSNT